VLAVTRTASVCERQQAWQIGFQICLGFFAAETSEGRAKECGQAGEEEGEGGVVVQLGGRVGGLKRLEEGGVVGMEGEIVLLRCVLCRMSKRSVRAKG
jgi:hypothetical protein